MKSIWKQCLAAPIALAIGAAAAAEGARPGDKPLVVNGDLSLTTLDFDAYMERVPPSIRTEFRADFEKINPTVDALWVRRVLAERARAAGMQNDPIVAARIRQAQEEVLSDAYAADFEKKIVVPNMEPRAREVYKTNIKQFTMPELYTAEHILVSTKTYPADKALARIQEVYKRAMAGEDFRKLAEEYTDNRSSIEIPGRPLTSFEKPLPEAMAQLQRPGDITPPVQTQFGYHIIKLQEKRPSRVRPFEEVKQSLMELEKQKYIDAARSAMAEAVRADPKTTLYVENVRDLKAEFKVPSAEELAKTKPNIRY